MGDRASSRQHPEGFADLTAIQGALERTGVEFIEGGVRENMISDDGPSVVGIG
jgi:hypothetical protein